MTGLLRSLRAMRLVWGLHANRARATNEAHHDEAMQESNILLFNALRDVLSTARRNRGNAFRLPGLG